VWHACVHAGGWLNRGRSRTAAPLARGGNEQPPVLFSSRRSRPYPCNNFPIGDGHGSGLSSRDQQSRPSSSRPGDAQRSVAIRRLRFARLLAARANRRTATSSPLRLICFVVVPRN
jgi:hypothetical protein